MLGRVFLEMEDIMTSDKFMEWFKKYDDLGDKGARFLVMCIMGVCVAILFPIIMVFLIPFVFIGWIVEKIKSYIS